MKILMLMAMEQEAESVLKKIPFKKADSLFSTPPHHYYQTEYSNHNLHLIVNGQYETDPKVSMVGTEPASIVSYTAINQLKPELVINLGTAGGRSQLNTKIGDIIIGNSVFFHDRKVSIPGFHERSLGSFQTWEHSKEIAEKLAYQFAPISSGNSFDLTLEDEKKISDLKTHAKDMEAAAIAWVCDQLATPLLVIKSITDLIDSKEMSSEEQFFQNLNLACENLAKSLEKTLALIPTN